MKTYHYPCTGLTLKITLENGCLTISGSLYHPTIKAHGQIQDHIPILQPYIFNKGWDTDKLNELIKIWNRWHLNNLRAGSPDQEAALRNTKITGDFYPQALAYLKNLGLHPDPNCLVDGKPYSYGSRWLKEELPEEVIKYLESL